ncbi:hypothetical protein OSSY52_08800 [Tepiditoga spiralis]|uniref:Stage II sporulation protein M n=1 Tax=Tepiditoga spiralis TaxID=2108365 RepID=A0A7G1GAY5_9BACT|nr:hypothetical protein OSSY52_08800 [Tepiditoga spiralis]
MFSKINYNTNIDPKKLFIMDVFVHNIFNLSLILIFGLITFGIVSSLMLLINGIYFGVTIHFIFLKYSFSLLFKGTFFHLFFELTAIFMTTAISFSFWDFFKKKEKDKKVVLSEIIIVFLISILLLFISAIIECKISSVLVRS